MKFFLELSILSLIKSYELINRQESVAIEFFIFTMSN